MTTLDHLPQSLLGSEKDKECDAQWLECAYNSHHTNSGGLWIGNCTQKQLVSLCLPALGTVCTGETHVIWNKPYQSVEYHVGRPNLENDGGYRRAEYALLPDWCPYSSPPQVSGFSLPGDLDLLWTGL